MADRVIEELDEEQCLKLISEGGIGRIPTPAGSGPLCTILPEMSGTRSATLVSSPGRRETRRCRCDVRDQFECGAGPLARPGPRGASWVPVGGAGGACGVRQMRPCTGIRRGMSRSPGMNGTSSRSSVAAPVM
jgi:hypothetical protein